MLFRPPFLTVGKIFVGNTSSIRIKLIKQLFNRSILNQAIALLPNPFQRGYPVQLGSNWVDPQIPRRKGATSSTMVVMFVG